jgi:hypothetical protein
VLAAPGESPDLSPSPLLLPFGRPCIAVSWFAASPRHPGVMSRHRRVLAHQPWHGWPPGAAAAQIQLPSSLEAGQPHPSPVARTVVSFTPAAGAVRGAGAADAHIQVPGGQCACPAGSRGSNPPRPWLPRNPLLQSTHTTHTYMVFRPLPGGHPCCVAFGRLLCPRVPNSLFIPVKCILPRYVDLLW